MSGVAKPVRFAVERRHPDRGRVPPLAIVPRSSTMGAAVLLFAALTLLSLARLR